MVNLSGTASWFVWVWADVFDSKWNGKGEKGIY